MESSIVWKGKLEKQAKNNGVKMKKNHILGFIIAIIVIALPLSTFAQEELLVEWSDGQAGILVNSLRTTILGDTTAAGERIPHVYKLRRGGLYHITDPLENEDFPLVIVGQTFEESGDDTDFGPAVIQRVAREGGEAPDGTMFRAQHDLTLNNVYIVGQTDEGVLTAYGLMKLQGSDRTYTFDNVIFDRNRWFYPHVTGVNSDFIVTNCVFRNIHAATQVWAGLAVEFTGPADTVIFENNTFVNMGGALYKQQAAPANYFRFNHNTVVNQARNFTWAIKNKFYAANNIFMNVFWNGETNADFTNPDRIDPYSGVFGIGDLAGQFGTNFGREIVLANNSNWRDPAFTDWYASPVAPDGTTLSEPIAPQPFVNDTTMGWFNNWDNMVMADNYLNENPSLTTPVPDTVVAKMKQQVVDLYNNITSSRYDWDDNRPASNIIPPWPLPIDFTYSNSTLLTGGTDGLPLGDLNWYPDEKALFEANKATHIAAIEDMVTAPDLVIASTIQGEDLTYVGAASEYVLEGDTWYSIENSGSITWTVDLAEAGTYSLVVHNQAPHGTKGNHIKVDGIGLKNRATNGEWIFDYTYPEVGWLATPMNEDSLADNSETPLQLTAGTHTISIESSWGWMNFKNVEVVNPAGTVVADLTAPDAVADGVVPGADADWVPEGFKAAPLDAGGAISGNFDAGDGGQYLARIYFAADGPSDVALEVNDGLASTVALADTGDTFSDFFGFSAGSNSFKFTSSSGGVKIDKIQFLLDNATVGVDNKIIVPDGFVLRENYPNPFNPSTTIEFTLPVSHQVNFAIYNILGQRVKVLTDARFSAGTHLVNWDGTNSAGHKVTSGQYFCMMEYGNSVKVIKLTLLK